MRALQTKNIPAEKLFPKMFERVRSFRYENKLQKIHFSLVFRRRLVSYEEEKQFRLKDSIPAISWATSLLLEYTHPMKQNWEYKLIGYK